MNNELIKIDECISFLNDFAGDIATVGEIITKADLANARSIIKKKKELKAGISEKHKEAKKQIKDMTSKLKKEVDDIIEKIDTAFEPAQKRLNFYNMKEREKKAEKQAQKDREMAEKMRLLEERKAALEAENEALRIAKAQEMRDFQERERLNNEIVQEGVKKWAEKIKKQETVDLDELGSGVHVLGVVDDEHVAVKAGLTISDSEFLKLMKQGRITVEAALLRWLKTNSSGLIVAKSQVEKKFMKSDGKEFIFIKIEVEK